MSIGFKYQPCLDGSVYQLTLMLADYDSDITPFIWVNKLETKYPYKIYGSDYSNQYMALYRKKNLFKQYISFKSYKDIVTFFIKDL
jgi:hypothetical protein